MRYGRKRIAIERICVIAGHQFADGEVGLLVVVPFELFKNLFAQALERCSVPVSGAWGGDAAGRGVCRRG